MEAFSLTAGVKHVFLSDAVLNVVTIFDRTGETRTLTGFQEPQGLTTDGSGNLYVANTISANVEVFSPPYRNNAGATLPDPGQWPVDVAVAKDGTVAAVNICRPSASRCAGAGSVVFYKNNRARAPCATVPGDHDMTSMLWDSFDANGTLYFSAVTNYTGVVIARIGGECNASSIAVLKSNTKIAWISGIQVDTNRDVAIINGFGNSGPPSIDVFQPKPNRRLKLLSQSPLLDSGTISSFALTKDGLHLFTAEPHYSLEYAYPQGGYLQAQLTPPPSGGNLIEGVAVTPAEAP